MFLAAKLQDLIIWNNMLSGEIPEEIRYVEALENLILDFNYLTGSIPSSSNADDDRKGSARLIGVSDKPSSASSDSRH